ncbi:MAG: hypothetical protein JWL76_2130 [Thermoleophilia bacterium]|nr:hypothetical protein [Thermoleophilia bacterium]
MTEQVRVVVHVNGAPHLEVGVDEAEVMRPRTGINPGPAPEDAILVVAVHHSGDQLTNARIERAVDRLRRRIEPGPRWVERCRRWLAN